MAPHFVWNCAPAVLFRQILDANPHAFQQLRTSFGEEHALTLMCIAFWQMHFVKDDGTLHLNTPQECSKPFDPSQLCRSWMEFVINDSVQDTLLLMLYLEAHRHTAVKRESIQVNVVARQVAHQKEGQKDYGGDAFAYVDMYYEDTSGTAFLVKLKLIVEDEDEDGKVKDPTPRSKELIADTFKEVKFQSRSYQLNYVPSNLEYWACLLEPEGWHCENVGPPLVEYLYCLSRARLERQREQCARLTINSCDDEGFQLVAAVDDPAGSGDKPSNVDGS
ncbi:hypothetical protein BC832DRAFT_538456 [Gaertneriomyces semiglobifer]|nr:hypothetical protein BC832DRAFT_538456 [Gaertneriomyces semiglobifer]